MSNCDLTRCRVCSCKWGGASEKACARGDCPVQRPMTIPGATEAVTPEQRAEAALHLDNLAKAMHIAAADVESYVGLLEHSMAARRQLKEMLEFGANAIIRSLLPKEEGN